MKRALEWLRMCLQRQIVQENELIEVTPFGRALLMNSRQLDQACVLYWVRLPSYEWMQDFCTRRYSWHQRVLFWHGLEGFSVHMVPPFKKVWA